MPFCRNCGSRITKFEKDICPICGAKKPLEGASSDTVEITSEFDIHSKEVKKVYDVHFRITAFLYFVLIGWTGVGFFYLKFKKMGLIWLLCNLAVIGGFIGLFIGIIGPTIWITYAAPFAIVYLVNIAVGIYYLVKENNKDGNGEFIR